MVRLTGTRSGTAYIGVQADSPPNYLIKDRRPTTHDYYNVYLGDMWLVKNELIPAINQEVWMLVAQRQFQATWIRFITGAGVGLLSLSGNVGGPVFGDANNNINVIGAGGLIVTGTPINNTLTIGPNSPGNVASQFQTDDNVIAYPDATGLLQCKTAIEPRRPGVFDNVWTSTPVALGNRINVSLNSSIYQPNTAPANGSGLTAGLYSLGNGADIVADRFMHNYGTGNAFLGNQAGNTTLSVANAQFNTGIGFKALTSLVGSGGGAGVANTAVGWTALANCTDGYNNTAVGQAALTALTTGHNNTAVGVVALQLCSTGSFNTAVGLEALQDTLGGSSNTAIGHASLELNISGNQNTGCGLSTLQFLLSGMNNTAVGFNSGSQLTGAENSNIYLNHVGINGESNTLRIGSGTGAGVGQLNKACISGIRGITTDVNNAVAVLIDSGNQLGTVSSSIRYKENVQDMAFASEDILKLRPVTFNYKNDASQRIQFGLIAEEVKEIFPELVAHDADGIPMSVKYHELPGLILNELQKLAQRVEKLEKKLK